MKTQCLYNNKLISESLISQRGSLVLIVLIVVALLAAYSLIGMKGTLYSTRLTSSFMSYSVATQRAEFALLQAINQMDRDDVYELNQENKPKSAGRLPQFIASGSSFTSSWFYIVENDLWRNDQYVVQNVDDSSSLMSAYFTEKLNLKTKDNEEIRRVTAKGWGYESSTTHIVQSLIKVGDKNGVLSWQVIH